MYVGRVLVAGPRVGAYRVSSRSFPNRQATERDGTVTVGPTPDAPETDNPYIAYNCLRLTDRGAVIGNGSHVVGVTDDPTVGDEPGAVVGTVRRDALLVEAVEEPTLVATYERDAPEPFDLDAADAAGAARELYDHEFEHRVCAAGVALADGGFETAVVNGE
ncbi:IMP cyclohydrolase [Halobacteriales archaeon SW_10_66_29]|nr:MAG: IMP cyclohydrolase [Halobacteriales archaeon SW_10_66_29]